MTSDDLTDLLASIDQPAAAPSSAKARVWERVRHDLSSTPPRATAPLAPANEDTLVMIDGFEGEPSVPPRHWHRIAVSAAAAVLIIAAAVLFDRPDQQLEIATDVTSETEGSGSSDEQVSAGSVTFDLVGGEVVKDRSELLGFAFADQPLLSISSPGPRIEVTLGDEVTINFTNRHGWSQDPDAGDYTSVDQSFRIYEIGGSVGDVLWRADTGPVAPGETGSVTFTPDKVGEYRYTSVGLVMTGMFGTFAVIEDP